MQFSSIILALVATTPIHAFKALSSLNSKVNINCPPRPVTQTEQRTILNAFYQTFYIEKNVTAAFSNFVAEDYIQHNPFALSGRQNAIDALASFVPSTNYTIQRTGFDGDLGWVHVKVEMQGQPASAVVDIFRMNGSCVQEHWDVLQAVPTDSANPIAMF